MNQPEAHTSAYVQKGHLHIVGLFPTDEGVIPFAYRMKVEGEVPEGPVHLGARNLNPILVKALQTAEAPIVSQVERKKMQAAAKDLVDRARFGEQNAEATLIMIRDTAKNAKHPNHERAKLAYDLCLSYAKVPATSRMHGDEPGPQSVKGYLPGPCSALRHSLSVSRNPTHYAATVMSHVPAVGGTLGDAQNAATALSFGPPINTPLLNAVRTAIGKKGERLFVAGVKLSAQPTKVLKLATQVAQEARDPELLQALQTGYSMGLAKRIQDIRRGAPLKTFSAAIAWELGE